MSEDPISQIRTIFEKLTGEQFPRSNPDFLEGMYYDGYCSKLKIAFAWKPESHCQFVPEIHDDVHDFLSIVGTDYRRMELSASNDVQLFTISHTMKKECWEEFIKMCLDL